MHKSTTLFKISFFIFAFSLLTFSFAQENKIVKTDSIKTQSSNQPNSPLAEEGDVKITDGTNTLIRITDEGTFGTIEIKTGVPSTTTDKLYNDAGTLKFNGSSLGGASGTTGINDLTDGKYDGASIFLGSGAGTNDDGGNKNTAVGKEALHTNNSGNENTANGYQALYFNTTGSSNTANGHATLFNNTTGNDNTANGRAALTSNTTGSNNTATGNNALYFNTTGNNNTANGYQALAQNTTGYENTAFGSFTLYSNTTGGNNTANGRNALRSNTSGIKNTANGRGALYSNTTGSFNSANGYQALSSNTTGNNNTANGVYGLAANTTGNENTAIGFQALYFNTTGNYNIGIGLGVNYYNQEGSNNTIIGSYAGGVPSTHNKSGNIFLGYKAGYYETGSNKLYIQNDSSTSPLIYGDFVSNKVGINGKLGIGTQNPSDVLHIVGTSGQNGLRVQIGSSTKLRVFSNGGTSIGSNNSSGTPANGLYVHGDLEYNGALTSVSDKRFKTNIKPIENANEKLKSIHGVYYDWNRTKFPEKDFTDKHQIGVIAQEVEKEFPELVRTGKDGYKSVDYSKLAPILIEAVKEQDERIKKLEEENENLKKQFVKNTNLKNKVELLEDTLNKIIRNQQQIRVSKN